MVKVEDFAKNTSQLNAEAIARGQNPAFLMGTPFGRYHGLTGNTDGWVPFLKGDGTPFTFTYDEVAGAGKSGWYAQFWCSWGATGKYSLADFEVLDKDGNVVYSFAGDTSLTNGYSAKPGVSPTAEGVYLWANDYVGVSNDTRIDYRYSIAETLTDHTADDYKIRTFDETYTPMSPPLLPMRRFPPRRGPDPPPRPAVPLTGLSPPLPRRLPPGPGSR